MNTLFADTLKRLRNEKGLSQTQLGEQMFVTRSTISRWENGSRLPDAAMLSQLARCLDVDMNVLADTLAESDESPNVIMVEGVQAQFEDSLFVSFDTSHTHFRLPPLTLQPIVENAVKHGMDPDSEPLHIYIRTLETDSGSEIIVEDNGPGFEPSENEEPHIALTNIKQRLEMMCGGKLDILPREGGGTIVKVTIP